MGLDRVCRLLGPWWRYIVSDASEGSGGNDERLAFLFDARKVRFGGMAGELVLPQVEDQNGNPVNPDQIARTPYIAGFKAGWFDFMLSTVHIKFGENERDDPQRREEIRQVANFLAKRIKQSGTWSTNLILLGDFNIFDTESPTFEALTDAGFSIPAEIQSLPATNVGTKPRKYDQIAFMLGTQPNLNAKKAGILDFSKRSAPTKNLRLQRRTGKGRWGQTSQSEFVLSPPLRAAPNVRSFANVGRIADRFWGVLFGKEVL